MEYVYGALVLHAAGKPVNEENLKKVLTAAGVKVDETRVKALTAALEGVNIDEALKAAVAMPTSAPSVPTSPNTSAAIFRRPSPSRDFPVPRFSSYSRIRIDSRFSDLA